MTAFEPCADVGEDRVERLVDRVGEDERAADHRDAEHDRDRRQRRPQLAAQQALERERRSRSRRARSIVARISCCARRGRGRWTIRPSARKRMRSAIAAARASCVTITVVWPYASTESRISSRISPPVLRVEVAGRLVGEDDGRPRDERARDRDALLLAARELGRAGACSRSASPTLPIRARRTSSGRASRRRSRAAGRCSPRRSASAAG